MKYRVTRSVAPKPSVTRNGRNFRDYSNQRALNARYTSKAGTKNHCSFHSLKTFSKDEPFEHSFLFSFQNIISRRKTAIR